MSLQWHLNTGEEELSAGRPESGPSLLGRFRTIAEKYHDCTAVVEGKSALTYAELNRASNRIAHGILSEQPNSIEPVLLFLKYGVKSASAIFGVLKSGRPYLALDTETPASRIRDIIDDSGASLVITEKANIKVIKGLYTDIAVITAEDAEDAYPDSDPGLAIPSEAPAVILYTSGSTGRPKGITHNHGKFLHDIISDTNRFGIGPGDRMPQFLSYSFALSRGSFFGILLNGGRLYMDSLKEIGFLNLSVWLIQKKITMLLMTPSLFRQFAAAVEGRDFSRFPDIRLVMLSGETVTSLDVDLLKKIFSDTCVLVNRYGSSETGAISRYHIHKHTPCKEGPLPVGAAVGDKKILILNDDGTDAGFDKAGNIAVESSFMATGYWRQPELTQKLFLPGSAEDVRLYITGDRGRMDHDGCLTVLGRKDSQLKIRGYRVEPAEVETALREIDGVREAVVVGLENRTGDTRLAAYVVMQDDPVCTISGLRRSLKKKLQDYMIPADVVLMKSLPLMPSGKIDRKGLPEPERKRPELDTVFIAPRDELETLIANICEEILDIHPVGVTDDLSDLGVDSILYFKLVLEIEKRCGNSLPLDTFPIATTVEGLSKVYRRGEMPAPSEVPVTSKLEVSTSARHIRKTVEKIHKSDKSAFLNASLMLPYFIGIKFLSWYCAQQRVQEERYYRKQVSRIRQVLTDIKTHQKESAVIRTSLLANVFQRYIYDALARSSALMFNKWVTVTGMAAMQSSHKKNQGLVLVLSHMALEHLTRLILYRSGFDDVLIFAGEIRTEIPELLGLTRSKQIVLALKNDDRFRIRQLATAKKTLDRGGIVLIAGDGFQGDSGITLPFHGRLWSFKAGFAELAVDSGADAIPAFVSIDRAGHVKVEFLNPLNQDMPVTSHKGKVEFLIRRYADTLEKKWADEPGNIAFSRLTRFLSAPEA